MRSPILTFSLVAAAVGPTLIAAAPISPQIPSNVSPPNVPGAPSSNVMDPLGTNTKATHPKRTSFDLSRRAEDYQTNGGNAYSGSANDVSGGTVVNESQSDTDVQSHTGGNAAGRGGVAVSGSATGGNGAGRGPGGNAYTGQSSNSNGGDVDNVGTNQITNATSNTGGAGGSTTSGDATGGNSGPRRTRFRRAISNTAGNVAGAGGDSTTGNARGGTGGRFGAGGNAATGAVGNACGGDINNGDVDGFDGNCVDNGLGGGGDQGGDGGGAFPGAPGAPGAATAPAAGGGNAPQPPPISPARLNGGGNAYTGSAGDDRGGTVTNEVDAGNITNAASNTGGLGGNSRSGNAVGGAASDGQFA